VAQANLGHAAGRELRIRHDAAVVADHGKPGSALTSLDAAAYV
jgi:hypothetical protein